MSSGRPTYYLIAIGGTAMTPLASLLSERGCTVLGSDLLPLYPPMSDRIAALGVEVRPGFRTENIRGDIDFVVAGNLVRRDNPELLEAQQRGLPVKSMPQTLHDEFLSGRHPVVIAGTHGKTTTTALTAWLLSACGREPGYLIGGEPANFPGPSAVGRGDPFVIEGDEYSTSYDDKGPKFLHYAPKTLVLTSIEFDHADLYGDLDEIKAAFRKGVDLVPPDGRIVANADDPNVVDVVRGARAEVLLYSLDGSSPAGLSGRQLELGTERTSLEVWLAGRPFVRLESPLAGRHNAGNALAAIGASLSFGLTGDELARAVRSFRGVKRRLEERGTVSGVTVIDDFAHHPTAVATTIDGALRRYHGRRLWAAFEPRSITGGRAEFYEAYLAGLSRAHGAAIALPFHRERLSREGGPGALDVPKLAETLRQKGCDAFCAPDADGLIGQLLPKLGEGDVVLVMSSGAFGGFCVQLLEKLASLPARGI